MIVCSCNAISDEKIKDAIRVSNNFEEFLKEIQYRYKCGVCIDELKEKYERLKE